MDVDEKYVHDELLELVSGAVEIGLAEYVGFTVVDGELLAETYNDAGEIVKRWKVGITVTEVPDDRSA